MNRRINGHTVASKAKVSVSVDRNLLREVDRLAGRMTRSQIFEHALAAWVRRRGQAELDQAIERYYRSLSAAERREDESWASLGDEMMRRGWDE
jgi:metal-responsive CopG/Arc/MetJ family transcriptional regulator